MRQMVERFERVKMRLVQEADPTLRTPVGVVLASVAIPSRMSIHPGCCMAAGTGTTAQRRACRPQGESSYP